MRLCERMALYENEILDERNHQLMQEFTHRQQMYEAQSATLKAFQAKKALLQVQKYVTLFTSKTTVDLFLISCEVISKEGGYLTSHIVGGPPIRIHLHPRKQQKSIKKRD